MRGKGRGSLFSLSSNTIFGITLVLALFGPVSIRWAPGIVEVLSLVWYVSLYMPGTWSFRIWSDWTMSIFIALVRCLFAYQVKRYCEYRARLVYTLILGCIAECFVLEVGIVLAYFFPTVWLSLPFPLMLVVAWILMRKRPTGHDEQLWVEEESTGAPGSKVTLTKNDVV